MLDHVLARLARGARVVISGAVSQYNATEPPRGPANYLQLLVARASMTGFVIFDYADRYGEGVAQLARWLRSGELRSREDVVEGDVDGFPDALLRLFRGENTGKLVLALGEPPIGGGRMTGMDPMSAQDAMFLHVEDDVTPMHIGGVSIFEGPPPPFAELRDDGRAQARTTRRATARRCASCPSAWPSRCGSTTPTSSLDYHLRHTAVPAPGDEDQLRAMAARVFSQHLDRARPLWELWMVEGLRERPLGAAVQGPPLHGRRRRRDRPDVRDVRRRAPRRRRRTSWRPRPEPSRVELVARSATRRALDPAAQVRAALRAPCGRAARRRRAPRGPSPRPRRRCARPTSSLTGPIGPHRVWSWAKAPLADVKAVRSALGGTVNDVVLTIVTRGFRDLLEARGEALPTERVVRTMVPVSVRRPGERGVYNNRVSAVFARLPVGIDDPVERLAELRRQMDGIKSSQQAVAGDTLAQLSGFAPPLLLALGSRVMTRSLRLNMDTATTNVPGPAAPRARPRPPAGRVLPLRPDRRHDPDRRRDLLLRRRALLRRHRRPRPRRGRRHAHGRDRGRPGRAARARGRRARLGGHARAPGRLRPRRPACRPASGRRGR